jgi:hypothetical protein
MVVAVSLFLNIVMVLQVLVYRPEHVLKTIVHTYYLTLISKMKN